MFSNRLCLSTFLSDIKTIFKVPYYRLYNSIICRQLYNLQNTINENKYDELLENKEKKLVKVAIIGVPNAGKSTLINHMMNRKVCPTSNKVHTTRKKTHAIFTHANTQIVFLDTPGIVSAQEHKKYKLEKSFTKDCHYSLNECTTIGVIHDISNVWTRECLDTNILRLLKQYEKRNSFLVLNKIDALKSKRKLLDLTKLLTENCLNGIPFGKVSKQHKDNRSLGWPNFNEVFMVSALEGDGVQDIKNYLFERAQPSEWMYPADEWTNQLPDDIVVKTVQATLLDFLPQEIPYRLKTQMEYFEILENGTISSVVLVSCPMERLRKLVVGAGDGKLRQITEKAQKDLMNTFNNHVKLKIIVTCNDGKNEKE